MEDRSAWQLKRLHPREEDVRGPYFRDQTAIIHSSPFRRLKHKTQVFFSPENDHVCTRIEHVLHVATIAGTICRGLRDWGLDRELAYAAGLGHDMGHAPFGHAGERALHELAGEEGFSHEVHGLRVVDCISRDGHGLNLTAGVRDAIICHNGELFEASLEPDTATTDPSKKTSKNRLPSTQEGCIVRFSDKIAYLGRDIEDALLAGFIEINDVPQSIRDALGDSNGEIINSLVIDLIQHSQKCGKIGFSPEKFELLKELRQFNYARIYHHPTIIEYENYCKRIVEALSQHLLERLEHPDKPAKLDLDIAFDSYRERMKETYDREQADHKRMVLDYVAGMTDNYALNCMQQITMPEPIKFIL